MERQRNLIKQAIWIGMIPLRITVHDPVSIGTQEYLLIASRMTYLWLYLPSILAYFKKYLDDLKSGEWWFEYASNPLPSHLPLGLLHDLLVGPPREEPWDIILRKGDYPPTILQFNNQFTLQSYWINQLKESCYVLHGNSRQVMNLSVESQKELWDAINAPTLENFEIFWKHANALFKKSGQGFKVPLRIHISNTVTQRNEEITEKMATVFRKIGKEQVQSFYLHGIEFDIQTRLDTIYPLCIYPDGFIHIATN